MEFRFVVVMGVWVFPAITCEYHTLREPRGQCWPSGSSTSRGELAQVIS